LSPFGAVIVLNLMIGLVTPPFAIVSYLMAAFANCTFEKVVKESIFFLVALLIVLAICMYLLGIVLWLPHYLAR